MITETWSTVRGLRRTSVQYPIIVPLAPEQFEDLCIACRTHTTGSVPGNISVGTCWDADRLDIGRVGIQPNEEFMTNPEAKRIAREFDFDVLKTFDHSGIISSE